MSANSADSTASPSEAPAWVPPALWVTGAAVCAASLWQNRFFFSDDAFISLRYAQHWLTLGEPVWNAGERVEGYTNFLHMALCTGLMGLGIPAVASARIWNAIAFASSIAGLVWALARTDLPAASRALGGASLLAAWSLSLWVWGGLEGPLFAAWILAGCLATLRALEAPRAGGAAFAAGLAFGLAILTRPDGAIFAGVAAGSLALVGAGSARARFRRVSLMALGGALLVLPHLAWRHAFYGAWLPNTFHAKATSLLALRFELGLAYLTGWAAAPPFWPLWAGACAATAWVNRRHRPVVFLGSCAVAGVAAVVWMGGDPMPAHRLLLPLLPILALLLAFGGDWLARAPVLGVALFALLFGAQSWIPGPRQAEPAAAVGALVGEAIREQWPAGSTVALNTAGSTPFENPDLRFIDMLGLNDAVIARRRIERVQAPGQLLPGHSKGDGRYVLSRRPDYIILGPAEGAEAGTPGFLSDLELSRSRRFTRCYRLRRMDLPVDEARLVRGGFQGPKLTFSYYERVCDDADRISRKRR